MEALAVKSSSIRKNFSEFIDNALYKRPQVLERNRDHIIAMNTDHLAVVLNDLKMTARIKIDEDNNYIAVMNEIDDLIGYGVSPAEALLKLAAELIEYAQDYLTDSFVMYYNAPNRKGHLPYVLKVMLYDSPGQVTSLLNVEH